MRIFSGKKTLIEFKNKALADTIANNGQDVFIGTPPLGTQEKLVVQLSEALVETPVHVINGSMDFLCEAITKL